MKTSKARLPKFFHRLFAFLEILSVVIGCLICFLILVLPRLPNSTDVSLSLGQIGLLPDTGALTAVTGNSETITINNLKGVLSIKNSADDLGAFARRSVLPPIILYTAFMTALFEFLRRLFRYVELGESFTERSVHLVHKIGVTIIIYSLLSTVAKLWHDQAIVSYLSQHAAVQGLKMAFTAPSGDGATVNLGHFAFQFDFDGVLIGLLVLALGEVFRQGLALQKENDLTI
jgi:hypothetical protein